MVEYQLIRKQEGEISDAFDEWFEQELKFIDLDEIPYDQFRLYEYKQQKEQEKKQKESND